jgi:hypothetical protein
VKTQRWSESRMCNVIDHTICATTYVRYMHILNLKHYACQLVFLSTLWCEKISDNDLWEDLAI